LVGGTSEIKAREAGDRRYRVLPKGGKPVPPEKSLDQLELERATSSSPPSSKSELAEDRFVAVLRAKAAEKK
jgi:hypothetical protein